ncbi:MAG TPA: replication-associated recombination protein A [Candidatus Saccharimonadia bacterium]|nr:replication-associated recombination protein A [Candidatus Saccharimonadia bacterium]
MNLFSDNTKRPLADRVRPRTLDEFIGQAQVVGEGQFLRTMITRGTPTSLILWGPPGTGKTTLARIIASSGDFAFEEISAVTSGLPDVKKVIERAAERKKLGQATVLFVDEIHRFNKAQQDAFLPHVETGTIILIGATTENPSFEVIGPLLSRSRVVVLEPLSAEQILAIIERATRELPGKALDADAARLLAELSAGDARVALGGLETAAELAGGRITLESVKQAMQKPGLKYDKNGEYHYNLISAYIKSLRGGSADAALFYLARMLEGGEDPKFIARRLVIFASEDIGVADNTALPLAVAAFQAIERIGLPEGRIILSQATIALATAPKDRRAYDAIAAAITAAQEHPAAEVPLHLRNAPTKLMKDLGYGQDYRWQPGFEPDQGFLPDELKHQKFFTPDQQ